MLKNALTTNLPISQKKNGSFPWKKTKTMVFFAILAFTISNPQKPPVKTHQPFSLQQTQDPPRPRPWKKTVSPSPTLDSLGRLWPRSFRREFSGGDFGTTFWGGKQTLWNGKNWRFFLFVCCIVWTFLFIALGGGWWLFVGCWLFSELGCGDSSIRRRNLHEAFGRKLMQNRLGENYSRKFGPILVKLASNKQTKIDHLGKLLWFLNLN